MDILKKKTGGFQAFTEALLQEKYSNEHFVNKMRDNLKLLNSKPRVVPEDSKKQTSTSNMKNLEQKVREYENFCGRVSSLVLGHGATFTEETINKDAVINELEQTRQILNMRELGLHETVSAFKRNFEREKTDFSQKSKEREDNLKKSLDEVNEHLAIMREEMRMVQKHHDEIIRDLVEAEVKKRLMRISQHTLVAELPLSLNPETIETDDEPMVLDDGSHQTDRSIFTSTETARAQPLFNGHRIHFQNVQNACVQISNDGKNLSVTK